MLKYYSNFACTNFEAKDMRKLHILLLLFLCSQYSYSQLFFDLGLKGHLSTTWLINANVFEDPDIVHKPSMGNGIGGKLGINFNEEYQMVGEVLVANFNQKFSFSESSDMKIKSIEMNSLDIPILFRSNSSDGGYFEIGTQYSMVKQVNETLANFDTEGQQDNSKDFDKSYFSALIGFGGYMLGWDNFGISLGFRFTYSFIDLVSAGGTGSPWSYKEMVTSFPSESYKATNAFSAGLVLEFNYDLGYFAKSPCGNRRQFILFN